MQDKCSTLYTIATAPGTGDFERLPCKWGVTNSNPHSNSLNPNSILVALFPCDILSLV